MNFFCRKLEFFAKIKNKCKNTMCEVIFYKVYPAPAGPLGPSTFTRSGKARQSSGVFKLAQEGLFSRI